MHKKKKIWKVVFVIGFLVMMYPLVSRLHYKQVAKKQVSDFEKKARALKATEIEKRMTLAKAYNATLDPSRLTDPYSETEKAGVKAYARMLEVGELLGHVDVPAIGEDLPVYAGSGENILQKGCGHMEGTSLPIGGKSTHAVLTAHRGLPTAALFRHLDKLKKGDRFYVRNMKETLAYEVDQIKVVRPWDFAPVMVADGKDYCTLLTCTPYMVNSDRLLVRGHRIRYVAPVREKDRAQEAERSYKVYFYGALLVAGLLTLGLVREKRRIRKIKRRRHND